MIIYNAATPAASTLDQLSELDQSSSDIVLTKTCTINPRDIREDAVILKRGDITLNHLGLPNPGMEYYHDVRKHVKSKPFYLSVMSECLEADPLEFKKLDGIEVNVSCPNLNSDICGYDMDQLQLIVEKAVAWRSVLPHLKVGLKLPMYQQSSHFNRVASMCLASSIDYVVCINTIRGCVDGVTGGISGPSIKPFALYNAHEFVKRGLTVIGCGGVQSSEDIRDYQRVGCVGVQVGTASLGDLSIFHQLKMGLIKSKL